MNIHIGWPQGIYLAMTLLSLGMELARHGELKPAKRYNFFTTLTASVIVASLFYWGGFFSGGNCD